MSTSPFVIVGLDHVVLRCQHLERTLAFYTGVLGCRVERTLEDLGLYQLRAGASLIDLVPVGSPLGGDTPPVRERFNLAHFCLRVEVESWEALATRLAECGIGTEPPARRYGADGYGLSVYIEDPEGNTVELKGPAE